MVSTTRTDKTEKLGITLPISLVRQTDKVLGDVPGSTFIRRKERRPMKQLLENVVNWTKRLTNTVTINS